MQRLRRRERVAEVKSNGKPNTTNGGAKSFYEQGVVRLALGNTIQLKSQRDSGGDPGGKTENDAESDAVKNTENDGVRNDPREQA
jgi:hypothetical protein